MFVCDKNFSCIGCNYAYADKIEDIGEEFRDCANLVEVVPVHEIAPYLKTAHIIPFKNLGGYKCSNCNARMSNRDVYGGNHIYCYKCGARFVKTDE